MGTTEKIVITQPSEKLLNLIKRMQEKKLQTRRDLKDVEPMFVVNA